ncbi:MAG: hypothetical protein BWY87_01164 [Deltaproteobacteria bacterium ADurb.Bin510]|nr:MAG: hypothetical protein BWY87_01164 [Deltaproteobacteria bacterium ADurb.Bin510]
MLGGQSLDGRQGFAAVAQVAVGVVFDQQDVVFLDDFGDLLAAFEREGAAGRVLEGRHQIDELEAVLADGLEQGLGNQTVVVGRHADVFGLVGVEGLQRAQVGGRFDGDLVTLADQDLAEAVQHALGAARSDDFARVGFDAFLRQEVDQGLAEGHEAFGQVVLEGLGVILVQHLRGEFLNDFERKAVRGRNAAGQRDHARPGNQLENFADGAGLHQVGAVSQQVGKIIGNRHEKPPAGESSTGWRPVHPAVELIGR